MKKLIITLLTLLLFVSCKTKLHVQNFSTPNGKMIGYTMLVSNQQLDSICITDTIPNDLSKWTLTSFNDFESNKRILKYIFIKNEFNTYTLMKQNDSLKITKRTILPL